MGAVFGAVGLADLRGALSRRRGLCCLVIALTLTGGCSRERADGVSPVVVSGSDGASSSGLPLGDVGSGGVDGGTRPDRPGGDAARGDGLDAGSQHADCHDGIQNGAESGVDCGGECEPCSVEDLCAAACQARAALDEGGFCAFDWLSGDCPAFCIDLQTHYSEAAQDAFAWCLENDPLCYQDIYDCLYAQMFPNGVDRTVTIVGARFEEYEAESVALAMEVFDEGEFSWSSVGTARVSDGGFELSFDVSAETETGHLIVFWVDSDGNGRCQIPADLTGAEPADRNTDIDEPGYFVILEPESPVELWCDAF